MEQVKQDDSTSKRIKIDPLSSESHALGNNVKFDWNADLSDLRASTTLNNNDESHDEPNSSASKSPRPSNVSISTDHRRTQEQYEELVKQASNDSQLWIEYMQFYIDQAEIDRARGLAERALASIFYR
jgi:rRNA biogenesis protein RRP5